MHIVLSFPGQLQLGLDLQPKLWLRRQLIGLSPKYNELGLGKDMAWCACPWGLLVISFNWGGSVRDLYCYLFLVFFYAPNFEEVEVAYWFRVVCLSKNVHPRVLKFYIWIPHGKIADTHFFLVRVTSLSGVMPLWKNQNEIWCMPYLVNHACQGFEI